LVTEVRRTYPIALKDLEKPLPASTVGALAAAVPLDDSPYLVPGGRVIDVGEVPGQHEVQSGVEKRNL
jgi:hypothetical protein